MEHLEHKSFLGGFVDNPFGLGARLIWEWLKYERCPHINGKGEQCYYKKGEKTFHPGFGKCFRHLRKHEEEAWKIAMKISEELNVTPWEALLVSVRRTAGRVNWLDQKCAEVQAQIEMQEEGVTSTELRRWLKESRDEKSLLARISKATIDAGVAERVVRQTELEGRIVARAIAAALDTLELSQDQRWKAFQAAQTHLAEGQQQLPASAPGVLGSQDADDAA